MPPLAAQTLLALSNLCIENRGSYKFVTTYFKVLRWSNYSKYCQWWIKFKGDHNHQWCSWRDSWNSASWRWTTDRALTDCQVEVHSCIFIDQAVANPNNKIGRIRQLCHPCGTSVNDLSDKDDNKTRENCSTYHSKKTVFDNCSLCVHGLSFPRPDNYLHVSWHSSSTQGYT